jgi:prepilin-type N-terminal cleavage/methylation domain-containing protein
MRASTRACTGFTLIELIAVVVILAILAAVALPRVTAASPFAERGYADTVAAQLRRARAVAYASGCEVRFTIDAAGYAALQRRNVNNHCAANGGWQTPVFSGAAHDGVTLLDDRQFVFAVDGSLEDGDPVVIDIGPHRITVEASGLVQGP